MNYLFSLLVSVANPETLLTREEMIEHLKLAFEENDRAHVEDQKKDGDLLLELMKAKGRPRKPEDALPEATRAEDIRFLGFRSVKKEDGSLVSFYYELPLGSEKPIARERFATNWFCHISLLEDEDGLPIQDPNAKPELHCHPRKSEYLGRVE